MNIVHQSAEKRLRALFSSLSDADRQTLLAFAEFLAARDTHTSDAPLELPLPQITPRPAQESVVAAIKRLSTSYAMLDKAKMLNETAGLMGQHIMQGREAADIIDELETIFAKHYDIFCQAFHAKPAQDSNKAE